MAVCKRPTISASSDRSTTAVDRAALDDKQEHCVGTSTARDGEVEGLSDCWAPFATVIVAPTAAI